MPLEKNFSGEKARRIREDKHMTQKQVADRAGIAVSTLSGLENSMWTPRDSTWGWIAGALGCEYDDLLEGESPATLNLLPMLNLEQRREGEEIALWGSVHGGQAVMPYFRAAGRHPDIEEDAANPSTTADIEATRATIASLAPRLNTLTDKLARRYTLFAEELDETKDIKIRTEVDAAIESLRLQPTEVSRSGMDFAASLQSRHGCLFDGLDGTLNLVAGLPFFSTAVAIFDGAVPVVGAIYEPTANTVYSANHPRNNSRGEASMWNIATGLRTDLTKFSENVESGILATHLSSNIETREEFFPILEHVGKEFSRIAMQNSGQLTMALVAAGCYTCFINFETSLWDTAAADVLVRSVGGRVTDFEGNAIDYRRSSMKTSVVAAACPKVHETVIENLKHVLPHCATKED